MIIHTFEVWSTWFPSAEPAVVAAPTAGKAKYGQWLDARDAWQDIPFTAMRARKVSPREPRGFRRNAEYRGIPFVRIGMRVCVGDRWGHVVGHDASANLRVLFGQKLVLSCHPHSEITYYGDAGEVLASYHKSLPTREGEVPPC